MDQFNTSAVNGVDQMSPNVDGINPDIFENSSCRPNSIEPKNIFSPLPNNRALSHLDLASKSEAVADGPIPGFTLLSIKRTSKCRSSYRARSVSSLTSTVKWSSELTDSNTIGSSGGDSSQTSSDIPSDDEDSDGFIASGSIEAEEFDDEEDDYDGANEDDDANIQKPIIIDQPISTSFMPNHKVNRHQNHVHRLIPDSTTDQCNGHNPSISKEHVSSHQSMRPSTALYYAESASHHRKRRVIHRRRSRRQPEYRSIPYRNSYNSHSYFPAHLQTNMSHFVARPGPMRPSSDSPIHTTASDQTPPSFSSFPPSVGEASVSGITLPFNINPNSIHTSSVHYPHYTRPPLSCPHHIHPTPGPTEHHITQGNQLSDEVSVNAAIIPPLQPASRFRKARIHETVEQWCHTRASVHDCRLKTIPDHVTELYKKSCKLEADVPTTGDKIHCSSCVDSDPALFVANQASNTSIPVHKMTTATACLSSQDQLPWNLVGSLRAISYICDWPLNDLLSFWDDGSRIEYQLSDLLALDPHNQDADTSFTNSANQSAADCCSLYTESRVSFGDPGSTVLDLVEDTLRPTKFEQSLPVAAKLTAPYLHRTTDPATAHLRRHQLDDDSKYHFTACLGGIIQRGDNPLTKRVSPDAATLSSCSPSPHEDSNPNLSNFDSPYGTSRLLPNGQLYNITTVPPTSPMSNCTNLEVDQHQFYSTPVDLNLSVVHPLANGICDQHTVIDPLNRVSHANYVYLRQRVGSGSYQNVNQIEQLPFVEDFDRYDNTTTSSLPPSPSDVSMLLPFGVRPTVQNTYGGSATVRAYQNGQGATPPTPRPVELSPKKKLLKGYNFIESGSQTPGSVTKKPSSTISVEARVEATLNALRCSFENVFRDELTAIHEENMSLLSEVDRLNRQVISLQKFRDAFFALRQVVPAEVWEQFLIKHRDTLQENFTQSNLPDSTLTPKERPPARPNSPEFNETS